ncbi:MAG: hypothetical protein ACYC23_24800, partial [Limisphaerales bacterium]
AAFRILHSQRETAQQLYYANLTLAQRHLEEGAPDRAMEVLLQCPEKFRHWEWGHLVSECHREVLTLTNAVDPGSRSTETPFVLYPKWRCQFSPDGKRLAAVDPAGMIWVWAIPSGQLQWRFTPQGNPAHVVAFSPDWKIVARATTNGVEVIPVGESAVGRQLEPGTPSVRGLAFSPDGRTLACLSDRGLRLWSSADGEPEGGFALPAATQGVSFTPNGEGLIAVASAWAGVYARTSGQLLAELKDPTGEAVALFVDAKGERAVTFDATNRIQLWTTNGLAIDLGTVRAPQQEDARWAMFSPDGTRFCTGGDYGTAAVRDSRTGHVLMPLLDRVDRSVFSPDGQSVATRGQNTVIRLWDVKTFHGFFALRGHQESTHDLSYSHDGRLLATVDSIGVVKVWSARSGRELFPVEGFPWAFSQSRDGRLAAIAPVPHGLRIWDTESGRKIADLARQGRLVYSSAFSPDGQHVATGGSPGEVCLWNFRSGRLVRAWKGHSNTPTVWFSPNGHRLISAGSDGIAKIWDPETGAELRTLAGHDRIVSAAGFSPDGQQVVTAGYDGTARVWDVESGECVRILRGHRSWVMACRFSPDGQQIASTGFDRTLRLWDARTGRQIACWDLQGRSLIFDYSPDGQRIAIKTAKVQDLGGSRPVLEIWDVKANRRVVAFQGNAELANLTQFSPDGRRLLTDWWELQVRQWESFPWREKDYPGSPFTPLAQRIQLYAAQYWADRLAMETVADEGFTPVVVQLPFTGAEVPVRDPVTPPECLDLTHHYTGTLDMISHMDFDTTIEAGDFLQSLPKGVARFDGIDFDVRGLIQLTLRDREGPCHTQGWARFPERVEGIPVRRPFEKLHALMGTTRAALQDTQIGTLM